MNENDIVFTRKGLYRIRHTTPLMGIKCSGGVIPYLDCLLQKECVKLTNEKYEEIKDMNEKELFEVFRNEHPEFLI